MSTKKRDIDLSIIIVSFNTKDITRKCLEYVDQYASEISHEVFVVDNASTDGSADMIEREFPWVKLIRLHENRGFAGGNIPAMKKATGKYVLLLNSDAFLWVCPLHRYIYTVGVIEHHYATGSPGADPPAAGRAVRVTFNLNNYTVDTVYTYGTVIETYHTGGLNPYIFLCRIHG